MASLLKSNPARSIKLLTASDTIAFADRPRGIIVGSGTVVLVDDAGATTSLADGVLASGVVHPISPMRINTTGTTAIIYGVY